MGLDGFGGIKIIREMTRDEMIDEITGTQRVMLEKEDTDALKRYVINFRLGALKRRLIDEAGFERTSLFDLFRTDDDEPDGQ